MPFLILILALLALTIGPGLWVQAVIRRYREPANRYPHTGGQTARHLLDTLGLRNVITEVTRARRPLRSARESRAPHRPTTSTAAR